LVKRQTEDRQFLESLLGKVTHELKQMRLAAEERLHQWQIASVELATALATELLYREVQANEFQVEQTIRTIVDELGEESPATIYLNPADLRAMQQRLGDQPLFPDLENPPTLIPTEAIARGDCKVQGRSGGELASEISERIALMREDLLEKLHART
jgi:flagellar biosynthesis/type III secretory pathway protein FliH